MRIGVVVNTENDIEIGEIGFDTTGAHAREEVENKVKKKKFWGMNSAINLV